MPDISVLIIDDEPSILKAVSMTLKQEHIAVTCADNGALALDYITKPFSKTVLVSKIRAMVRRTNQYVLSSDEAITEVKKGSFTLRMESQTVLKNGKEISLTSKEFSLLYLFIENPEYIFSKQELFSKVWRSDNCDDSTILVYIKKLRDKLEDDPSHPTHICTVWGKGYKFCI